MDLQIDVPKITIDEVLHKQYPLIDVRSPKEFEEFHMPHAVNIPIFSNEERAIIGTLYKQKGKSFAVEKGIEIFSKKLPDFFQQVKHVHEENVGPIVVYCWRGGMRSKSVVSFLGSLGLPLIQLDGGIRSYRYKIMESLQDEALRFKKFIVLEGLTGTRKTDMLEILQAQGYPVIDLEKYANHRGSVFGGIGKIPSSQKQFEAMIFERLRELIDSDYYIIEAESKRIGRVSLPDFILNGKEKGIRIHIDAPLSERVKTIKNMYVLDHLHHKLVEAFMVIKKRIPKPIQDTIMDAFERKDYDRAFSDILLHYYDPKYTFAANQYDTDVNYIYYTDFMEGFNKVKEKIDELISAKQIINSQSH